MDLRRDPLSGYEPPEPDLDEETLNLVRAIIVIVALFYAVTHMALNAT